jgi:hypothetical protein
MRNLWLSGPTPLSLGHGLLLYLPLLVVLLVVAIVTAAAIVVIVAASIVLIPTSIVANILEYIIMLISLGF